MTTSSGTDIQELKEFISDRFNELKLEMSEIKGEIKVIDKEIEGVNKRLTSLETSVQKISGRSSGSQNKRPKLNTTNGKIVFKFFLVYLKYGGEET